MKKMLVLATVSILPGLLLGCGTGGTVAPHVNTPQISRAQVSFEGGTVTISADIWHGFGVQEAWAEVQQPDGTKQQVTLVPGQGNHYEGTLTLPLNADAHGESQVYTVWIRARSYDGRVTPAPGEPESGMTVEVQAPPQPPAPGL